MFCKLLGTLVIALALLGCGKKDGGDVKLFSEKRDTLETPFTIEVARVNGEDEAAEIAEKLKDKTALKFYLEQDYAKGKKYSLKLGSFNTAYSAGKEAFSLWKQKAVENYIIKKNKEKVDDNYSRIIFPGSFYGQPILYSYNLLTSRTKPFWSPGRKKVVDLSYSEDKTFAFAIALSDYGSIGGAPFFKNAVVYKIDMFDFKVEAVDSLESGLQIYTDWENDHLYKATANYVDKKYSAYIVMNSKIYNKFGKILLDEKKSFDLIKDGYPAPVKPALKNISPDEAYSISVKFNKDSARALFLKDVKGEKEIELFGGYPKLKRIEWTIDGRHLIFSAAKEAAAEKLNTKKKDAEPLDVLVIYSLAENKIIAEARGENYNNFYVRDDLLFYDEGYGASSKIIIYDLSAEKPYNVIQIPGGCGVRNIPEKGLY